MINNSMIRKKMKKLIFILICTISLAFAKEVKHEHGAHVHGAGKLSIAFDGKSGKIEYDGAAEGILGFEHKAKSNKDKKTLADSVSKFEKDISTLIQFDSSLGCKFENEEIGQVPEDGEKDIEKHSDWQAKYSVTCDKSPVGTKIKIDFTAFKLLKDLDVTVIADSVQKSEEFKGKPVFVDLK